MLRRILLALFLAVLTAVMTGCAAYQSNRLNMETMPQKYQQFDLRLGWNAKTVDNKTVIEGVAKNVRYGFMFDLEIWVYVLDAEGKETANGMTFVIPSQLPMDDTAEFEIKLPVAVEPGTKLRFTYKYKSDDGGDDSFFGVGPMRSLDWMMSFDAVMPAPSTTPPNSKLPQPTPRHYY